MFTKPLLALVRAIGGSRRPHAFSTEDKVKTVVSACDAGLCRLVPENNHKDVLVDVMHGDIRVGVELTDIGKEALARLRPQRAQAA